MKKEIEKIPLELDSTTQMKEPNEPIQIYHGTFIISTGEEFIVKGKIFFRWLPIFRIVFEGEPEVKDLRIVSFLFEPLKVKVNGRIIGGGYGTEFTGSCVKGVIQSPILGNKDVLVNKIRFSVPNLNEIFNADIRNKNMNGFRFGRLVLESKEFSIKIDSKAGYRDYKQKLKAHGGFFLLHNGELVFKRGTVSIEKVKETIACLSVFLGFLNGGRTATLFVRGGLKDEEDIEWEWFPTLNAMPYKCGTKSWVPTQTAVDLSGIWETFNTLWFKKGEKDFLQTLLHWYIEANNYSGFVEGSIVMAQNALELIYNWWIVEQKGIIKGKDAVNISGANKIRLIVAHLEIEPSVPERLKHLRALQNKGSDGPDRIVWIRNAIIHSREEKRKSLGEISVEAKNDALQLSLYYIELFLLNLLGYQNVFMDRTNGGYPPQDVPWVKENKE